MRTRPANLMLISDTDQIWLRPANPSANDPVVCSRWDLGAPDVRATSADVPYADGTVDRSGFTGSRSVTLDLRVFGDSDQSAYAYVERLAAMTHPSIRPKLVFWRDPTGTGQSWELLLRGAPFAISYGAQAASGLELQLSFVAPLGYLESQWRGQDSLPVNTGVAVGYSYPRSFPISTGTMSLAAPVVNVVVGGSAPINPLIYIYGPCVNPTIYDGDGAKFTFTNLTLTSGTFVEIDMGAATVRRMGDYNQSVYNVVDFNQSTFWTWRPGAHAVYYQAAGGQVSVRWRDRRFTI